MKIKMLLTTFTIILVVLISGCKKDDYVETIGIYPTVTLTNPVNAATNIPLSKIITATFNVEMNPATITNSSFTIKGATDIAGTISYIDHTATFTPSSPLAKNTTYTGTIAASVKDIRGNNLQSDYVWTFSTGAILAPVVILVNPVNMATNVPLNKVVTAKFNMPMDPLTIIKSTVTLKQGTTTIVGTVAFNDSTASFTPSSALLPGTVYIATITTGAKNVLGQTIPNDYVWTFTTNAIYSLNVTATNGTVVKSPNSLTYNSGTDVQLTPTPNSGYIFTSWSGDASGTANPLTINMNANKNITANFTASDSQGPGVVNLKSTADFTILSKTGISTIGVTSISGNIGVSPATATAITGFSLIMDATNQFSTSLYVNGKVYASDYTLNPPSKMTTAVSDMENAFTTANGMTTTVIVEKGAGNISGMTLAPGLYKWSTGLLITNAGVTLSGGANDTWVFQIAQGLTVNNSAIIHLTGGAQAKNIFWITASNAVIGSNVNFSGNILSQTLISLNTGAKVTGRLLAQSAVTLNTSTVILP